MRRIDKENKSSLENCSQSSSCNRVQRRTYFCNPSRELMITSKLLKDITTKSNIAKITNLNLKFKDERFPKIRVISGLEDVPNLRTLNLSFNVIEKIEGLSHLTNLTDLDLSENYIKVVENLVSSIIILIGKIGQFETNKP